ncbi:MAG: hypothetical protein RMJ82_09010, partial [Gemmatales bacterium]|nr:hypothetical protein [Gemmatales bacterium]
MLQELFQERRQPVQMLFHPDKPILAVIWTLSVFSAPGAEFVIDPDTKRDDTQEMFLLTVVDWSTRRVLYEMQGSWIDVFGFDSSGQLLLLNRRIDHFFPYELLRLDWQRGTVKSIPSGYAAPAFLRE